MIGDRRASLHPFLSLEQRKTLLYSLLASNLNHPIPFVILSQLNRVHDSPEKRAAVISQYGQFPSDATEEQRGAERGENKWAIEQNLCTLMHAMRNPRFHEKKKNRASAQWLGDITGGASRSAPRWNWYIPRSNVSATRRYNVQVHA